MAESNKIEIKQREDSTGVMTGANTQIFLNGERVRNCRSIKFEVEAGGLAKVTMEMVGTVAIYGEIGELEKKFLNLVPEKLEDEDGSTE